MEDRDVSELPRFAKKDTRKLAEEAIEAGFVYVGDDTKGHSQFLHADSGFNLSLSETPGRGQIKRVRDIIARATGHRRGGFDRAKQRQKQAALHDVVRRDQEYRKKCLAEIEAKRATALWRDELRLRVEARWRELREIDLLMRTAPGGRRGRSIL